MGCFRCVCSHDLGSTFPKFTWCPNTLTQLSIDPLIAPIQDWDLIGFEMWYWKLCINSCALPFLCCNKIILFSFQNIHECQLLSKAFIICKYLILLWKIFLRNNYLFSLINPVWGLSPVHAMTDLVDFGDIPGNKKIYI